MNASEFLSDDFKAADLVAGPRVLTIKSVVTRTFEAKREGDRTSVKLYLSFEEDRRGVSLNGERTRAVIALAGDPETDNWAGTKIELFYDPNARGYSGARGGIGVRAPGAKK